MKTLTTFCALLLISTFSYSQKLGFGFGTDGINVKTAPFDQLRFIGRVSPVFSKNLTYVNASFVIARNLIVENSCSLYLGLGLGSNMTEAARIIIEDGWLATIPLGFEYFPFSKRKISFAAEVGPQYSVHKTYVSGAISRDWKLAPKGLIEFSIYLF